MQSDDHLRTLFATFDTDGSGTLDAEELLAILTRGASGLSLEDAKEIVDDFDENKDGVLSVDEFCKAMASVGAPPALGPPTKVGEFCFVASGYYEGRVGQVQNIEPDSGFDGKTEGKPNLYMVTFTDMKGGGAKIGEGIDQVSFEAAYNDPDRIKLDQEGFEFREDEDEDAAEKREDEYRDAKAVFDRKMHVFSHVEGKLLALDKAQMEARLKADRDKWVTKRKAYDAAQEAAMQAEWEKRGKKGRVPRVGEDRTAPVHCMWYDLPWFDQWVADGCDHQVLGISAEGIRRLLEEENFGTIDREDHRSLDWVTQAFGNTGFIGYDLGQVVRDFDVVSGQEDKSILEIILTRNYKYWAQQFNPNPDGDQGQGQGYYHDLDNPYAWNLTDTTCDCPPHFGRVRYNRKNHQLERAELITRRGVRMEFDWTKHVGPAHAFYSHIQLKPVQRTVELIEQGLETYEELFSAAKKKAGDADGVLPRIWLDYFNLRQCRNDFVPADVLELVSKIGMCLIEWDFDPTAYLSRTFCALEAFAAVKGGVPTGYVVDVGHALSLPKLLAAKPVKVIDAQTRRKKDKDKIDAFITSTMGFAAVDEAITKAALGGTDAIKKRSLEQQVVNLSGCQLDAMCVPGTPDDGLVEFIKQSRGFFGGGKLEALTLIGNKFDRASCEELIAAAAAKGISLCGLTKEERLIATVKPVEHQMGLVPPSGDGQYDYLFAIADIKLCIAEHPKCPHFFACMAPSKDPADMPDIVNFVASEPKIVSFACSGYEKTTALIAFAKMLKSNTSLINLNVDMDYGPDCDDDPEGFAAQEYYENHTFADSVPVMEAIFKYCMDSDVDVLKEFKEMYAERDEDSWWWRQKPPPPEEEDEDPFGEEE